MTTRAKKEYLRQLVAEKNRSFRPLTPEEKALGFLGWHERGYLPHCDYPGLIQFVTFRLGDSMPSSSRGEWEHLLKIEDVREKRTKLEEYLDRGVGECHLSDPRIANLTEATLLHFHKERYELLAWCVMLNHVHVLVHVWRTPLGNMVRSWKQWVETRAKTILSERRLPGMARTEDMGTRRAGRPALQSFWQREYWDTFMRDAEQEKKAVHYIEGNPVKAKLCRGAEDWPFGSVRFRDEFQRLVTPNTQGTCD